MKLIIIAIIIISIESKASDFILNDQCPPTFEKLTDGTCKLRTLYDFYDSPPQHGGVKVKLPLLHDRYTPEQIDLGRYLFFDPILSINKDMSCASCHQPDKGLSDGRKRSLGTVLGVKREELTRSTPTLWNVAFLKRFMWDGRADTLLSQAAIPLLSPLEMGNNRDGIINSVQSSTEYSRLFSLAYREQPNFENITSALVAFQSSLISFNSRYDRYAHGGEDALNKQEIRGYNAFRGFVARCSQCHVPPLFTDSELAVIGAPANDKEYVDDGAGALSDDVFLKGAFKVPTLRNISKTAPYFHSGQFNNLLDVVSFYNNTRGHKAPKGQELKLHWHIHMTDGPKLSKQNIDDIVAFLHSLEDEKNTPIIPQKLPSGLPLIPSLSSPIYQDHKKDNNK
ncbi:c-type cytochrome [Neptunomonas concharum]|uniref:C-type cytochrome n=2 Tax=Neptunomonas concharum TaxID=1031538 RepID=A0A5P1RFJ4_9GAMM|nr:c-type cytochrome [Neptunomonas concharum]